MSESRSEKLGVRSKKKNKDELLELLQLLESHHCTDTKDLMRKVKRLFKGSQLTIADYTAIKTIMILDAACDMINNLPLNPELRIKIKFDEQLDLVERINTVKYRLEKELGVKE